MKPKLPSNAEARAGAPDAEPPTDCGKIARRLVELQRSTCTPRSRALRTFLRGSAIALPWLYVLSLLLVWAALRFLADRWWFGTVMLFSPRWIYSLPLPALVPLCLFWDRRRWPVLLLGIVMLLFPVMDFRLPWGRPFAPAGTGYRVLTCNLHYEECDLEALRFLIAREKPDFIALQDCRYEAVQAALTEYRVLHGDQLLVASRFPLREIDELSGPEPPHDYAREHAAFYAADTPAGQLIIGCVHFPSPRYGLSNVLDRRTGIRLSRKQFLRQDIRLRWEVSSAVKEIAEKFSAPLILAGDFNAPTESAIYRDHWSSYRNAFSRAGFGFGRTFECEVRNIPFGVRIDHILCSPKITPARCWIGPSVGSEHLPVLADLICE
ncbi:MAG: endonuclease/exonuclease/phosphatase family protein [Pirellulales bacterium]|nr:endonuclease/exonuclease/phosphatase family protein [Pirellulales bacterium]